MTGHIEGSSNSDLSTVVTEYSGAGFEAYNRAAGQKMACFQQGPRAEDARLTLSRSMIQPGEMQGQMADGRQITATFSDGAYTSKLGNGRFETETKLLVGIEGWTTQSFFTGGPFDGAFGQYEEDEQGNRTLRLENRYESRGAFSVSSSSETVAGLVGTGPARPTPIYGPNRAPAGQRGGLNGNYESLQYTYNGITSGMESVPYTFFADGYFFDETPSGGQDIDCTRTRPNGAPYCLRYEVSGNTIRMELYPGVWDDDYDGVSLVKTADGFEIDEEPFARVKPLTGMRIDQTYVTEGGFHNGGVMGGATITSTWSGGYRFTSDGRFESRRARDTKTFIPGGVSPDAPIIGGGGANNSQSAAGRYAFNGNWLELSFDDGRKERLWASNGAEGWVGGKAGPDYLKIDDELYWVEGKE